MDFRTVPRIRPALLAVSCLGLAALSALAVAPAPSYDPWSWLLWGREVAHGTLSTAEGPAFKPLPVAVTAVLAPLGAAAPVAWVLLARAAAVAAVALAFVVARRAAGTGAGLLAAVAVALTGAFPRYAATGDVTGLLLALALAGVLAWHAGRLRLVLACAAGCALLRVEAWPFALVLGAVLWRRDRRLRPALGALAVAVPAAWFVPEWLGSGDVLRSSDRARIPNPGQPALADVPLLAALGTAAGIAVWPLLAAGVAGRPRRTGAVLLGAGAAWVLLVAVMAQAGGFSGEPRYALPGVALAAVGAAIAAVRLPAPLLVVAVAASAAVVAPRVARLDDVRAAQEHQWRLAADLDDAIALAGGRDAVLRCGTPYVGPLRGPLLAYRLDVEKRQVEPDAPPVPPGVVFASRRRARDPVTPLAPAFEPAWRAGVWQVRARCRA